MRMPVMKSVSVFVQQSNDKVSSTTVSANNSRFCLMKKTGQMT